MNYIVPAVGTVTFTNIEQIRSHDFYGSYAFDEAAFVAIDEFVNDDSNSIADRAEALKIMGMKGMGLSLEDSTGGMSDEELVADHILNG